MSHMAVQNAQKYQGAQGLCTEKQPTRPSHRWAQFCSDKVIQQAFPQS